MKKRDQAQARYPQHKQDFFHERKEKVYFIAFSRFLLPVDIQDILFTSFIFIREICRHNTTSQRYYTASCCHGESNAMP